MLGVLTGRDFYSSLFISHILAKAIPVRGATFKKPAFEQAFCFSAVMKTAQLFIKGETGVSP
ncbi:hypothetical protein RBJ30_16565 [Pluralibacter gergoviae]|uniref:Uncharacterized protein n=1 Tax=Pluralibacter gergoviae TaxID=61647 RepID=A0AAW8HQB3_PLUGE|nr:hypothetical protein [Pluralibacter gergoviae]MDQ2310703.1 hypothetical protein [Pluralibacter gergoviae]